MEEEGRRVQCERGPPTVIGFVDEVGYELGIADGSQKPGMALSLQPANRTQSYNHKALSELGDGFIPIASWKGHSAADTLILACDTLSWSLELSQDVPHPWAYRTLEICGNFYHGKRKRIQVSSLSQELC